MLLSLEIIFFVSICKPVRFEGFFKRIIDDLLWWGRPSLLRYLIKKAWQMTSEVGMKFGVLIFPNLSLVDGVFFNVYWQLMHFPKSEMKYGVLAW